MSRNNVATVLPFTGTQQIQAPTAPLVDPVKSVILQGAFTSETAPDEFLQSVTMHGVTFLRCASFPLPRPTINDLSSIERLARTLSRIWSHQSDAGKLINIRRFQGKQK